MAKPENWENLSLNDKQRIASSLIRSMRGSYIMGQALVIAAEILKDKEPSNAQDMEMLQVLFFDVLAIKAAQLNPVQPPKVT